MSRLSKWMLIVLFMTLCHWWAAAQSVPPGYIQAGSVPAKIVKPETVVIGWVDGNASDIDYIVNTKGPSSLLLLIALSDYKGCLLESAAWSFGIPLNLTDQRDRDYANAWLLHNSSNHEPPTVINPQTQLDAGDFRLFNAFGGGKHIVKAGITPIPCLPGHLHLGPAGEDSPYMGASGSTSSGGVYQLSEGRLGKDGQRVSATINYGRTVP